MKNKKYVIGLYDYGNMTRKELLEHVRAYAEALHHIANERKTEMKNHVEIPLTRDEWVEVYYSLLSKIAMIAQGDLDPETKPGESIRWINDLHATANKIAKHVTV